MLCVSSLIAKRLETYKDFDSDSDDWTKCLSLPPDRGAETITLTWRGRKPLSRCQSAQAHVKGHSRSRSLGNWGNSPSQVAFSSTIVSNTFSIFRFCCIQFSTVRMNNEAIHSVCKAWDKLFMLSHFLNWPENINIVLGHFYYVTVFFIFHNLCHANKSLNRPKEIYLYLVY